jgi:hypothetical protein
LITPRTVYLITYVWTPVTVWSGLPIRSVVTGPSVTSRSAGAPLGLDTSMSLSGYSRTWVESRANSTGIVRMIPCRWLVPKS